MPRRRPLPPTLGRAFSVRDARDAGLPAHRLRAPDLESPFHGVRLRRDDAAAAAPRNAPTTRARVAEHGASTVARRPTSAADTPDRVLDLALAYAPRLTDREFFSHDTAALLWGAPLDPQEDRLLHVSTHHPRRAPRVRGIRGHAVLPTLADVTLHAGIPLTTPASTWAMLGAHSVDDLVVAGDHFARVWRPGYGRPHPGRPPLAGLSALRDALEAGRRLGARRLHEALDLIREDSWSPMETRLRLTLVRGGLPEPRLNVDVYDDSGLFLACVDLCYPEQRVVVEYHGMQHGRQYAHDVERMAALRADGWTVIEVTWPLLFAHPGVLVRRVADAL